MVETDRNWSVKRNGGDRVQKSAYKSRGELPANQNAGRYHFSETKGYGLPCNKTEADPFKCDLAGGMCQL